MRKKLGVIYHGDNLEAETLLRRTMNQVCLGGEIITPEEVNIHGPENWDLLVACGAEAVKGVMGKEFNVKITKQAGQTVKLGAKNYSSAFDENGDDVYTEMILQLSPAFVLKKAEMKGGDSEKMQRLWLDVWEQVSRSLEGEEDSEPEACWVETDDEAIEFLDVLVDWDGEVAYDYETWGDVSAIRPDLCRDFKIATIGLSWKNNSKQIENLSFCFDRNRSKKASARLEKAWTNFLRNFKGTLIAHFARYEHKANIKRFGFTREQTRCTLLMLHALDELADGRLDRLMVRQGIYWNSFKQDYGEERLNAMTAPVERVLTYQALDAHATLLCYYGLLEELQSTRTTGYLPTLDGIARMDERFSHRLAINEMRGLAADHNEVGRQMARVVGDAKTLLREFRALPQVKRTEAWAKENIKRFAKVDVKDVEFNPRSTPMMRHLLVDELGIEPPKVKKNGKESESFGKRELQPLVDAYPVLGKLNAYRSAAAMEVFLKKWPRYTGPENCIHTSYSQTIVVTGRLSSTEPPLQNIPKENEVRRVFVSRFGKDGVLFNADYQQQEPRLMAGWSQDEKMIEAILSGLDLHRFVGAEVHDVDYEDVDAEQRDLGKKMNLGLTYGMTEHGLSAKAHISLDKAARMIEAYNAKFPGISEWREGFHRQAIQMGFVEDLFGARRHLPGAQSSNKWEVGRALRQAGNYPIQSTAYRFTQIAVCTVDESYEEELEDRAFVVGQVHDSIIVDCHKSVAQRAYDLLVQGMLVHNYMPYWEDKGMPMAVDIKMGRNLYDMVKV